MGGASPPGRELAPTLAASTWSAITDLLSDADVDDNDDEFHTWRLRLTLGEHVWEQHVETVRQLRRIAEHWPPHVAVTPEAMSPHQWVLGLT